MASPRSLLPLLATPFFSCIGNTRMYPRSTCASLFVLFLLWGIAWVVRQALRSIGMQPETATEEGQAGSSQPGQQQKSDISSKVCTEH